MNTQQTREAVQYLEQLAHATNHEIDPGLLVDARNAVYRLIRVWGGKEPDHIRPAFRQFLAIEGDKQTQADALLKVLAQEQHDDASEEIELVTEEEETEEDDSEFGTEV